MLVKEEEATTRITRSRKSVADMFQDYFQVTMLLLGLTSSCLKTEEAPRRGASMKEFSFLLCPRDMTTAP
jgi:hypothetical protein